MVWFDMEQRDQAKALINKVDDERTFASTKMRRISKKLVTVSTKFFFRCQLKKNFVDNFVDSGAPDNY